MAGVSGGAGTEALDRANGELAQVVREEAQMRRAKLQSRAGGQTVPGWVEGLSPDSRAAYESSVGADVIRSSLNTHGTQNMRATFAEAQSAVKAADTEAAAEATKRFKENLTVATAAAAAAAGAFNFVAQAASYQSGLQKSGAMDDAQRRASVGQSIARMGGDKALQDQWAEKVARGETGNLTPAEVTAALEGAASTGQYGLISGGVQSALGVVEQGMKGNASGAEIAQALSKGPLPGVQFQIGRLGAATTGVKTRAAQGFVAGQASTKAAADAAGAEVGRKLSMIASEREAAAQEGNAIDAAINTLPSAGLWDRYQVYRENSRNEVDAYLQRSRADRVQKVKLDTPPSTTQGTGR